MRSQIDISVVVCTYNRAVMLRRTLQSLAVQQCGADLQYEVIVVDDGSTDKTADVVREAKRCTDRPVTYIRVEGVGVAAARNVAVQAARGEWIAFCDDDQVADSVWLRELCRAQHRTSAVCIGGARSLELSEAMLAVLPKQIRLILGEIPAESDIRRCTRDDLVCTGNLFLRRGVILAVGGFDESLKQGGEDTDLILRVRTAGHEIWYTPYAQVRHIIPTYRLEGPYLYWSSLRGGECFAMRDCREWGRVRAAGIAAARVAHVLAVHLPMLAGAWATNNEWNALARKCSVVRAWGYARRAATLLIDRAGSDSSMRGSVEFRNERALFSAEKTGETKCA